MKDKDQTNFTIKNREYWIILSLLGLLVLMAYFNSLGNAFVSDDIATILNNENLKNFNTVLTLPAGFIRPLLNWIAYSIGGLNPSFYRIYNIFFHLGSVFLVYIIVSKNINKKVAIFSSSLFAVHSAIMEAVTWISGGIYAQYSFFLLLSFSFYIYSHKGKKYYFLSMMAYFLSLESHVISVIYPLILILYEFIYGDLRKNWLRLMPFFILSFAWVMIGLASVPERSTTLATTHRQARGIDNPLVDIPVAITTYLQMLIFPYNLTLYHSDLISSQFDYYFRVIMTILFFGVILFTFKKNKNIFFWLSFFVIALSPTLNPFRFNWVVAERYAYLGSIGIFVTFAILLDKFSNNKSLKSVIYPFFIILLIILTIRTIVRNTEWRDQDALWLSAAPFSPSSPNNHNNLGDYYGRHGDNQNSIREFKAAIAIKPDYADAYHNLGNAYMETGNLDEAIKNYNEAIKYNPNIWQTYQNLAGIYFAQGKVDLALEDQLKAVKIFPNNPNLYTDLAIVYLKKGDINNAQLALSKSLSLDPNNQRTRMVIGQLQQPKK